MCGDDLAGDGCSDRCTAATVFDQNRDDHPVIEEPSTSEFNEVNRETTYAKARSSAAQAAPRQNQLSRIATPPSVTESSGRRETCQALGSSSRAPRPSLRPRY